MISLDRNLSETWAIVNGSKSQSGETFGRAEFLSFQLQKLVDSMPSADFAPPGPSVNPPAWLRSGLRHFCNLRVHHIKMLNYVASFQSIDDLISQPGSARTLLNSAADSVDIQQELMLSGQGSSPLLRPSAVKLLLSSLFFMLLVASRYPADCAPLCSKPFHTAIDILVNVQSTVKDPGLDIGGALDELQRIAKTIQLPNPKRSTPLPFCLGSCKEMEDLDASIQPTHQKQQGFAGSDVFENLEAPDPNIFSLMDDVNITGNDIFCMSNMFG
jgi:hypothetical protein